MRRRVYDFKNRRGIALIIALFTVFAVLTMGVTYIGISLTNSRASAGYEKEAMIVSFANSGIEFALNYMGNPRNWEETNKDYGLSKSGNGVFSLKIGLPTTTLGEGTPFPSPVTVRALSLTDEFYRQEYQDNDNKWVMERGRVISTQPDLATLGIVANNSYFGDWQILVYPEVETGSGETYTFNTNFRVIVRARIYSGNNPTDSNVLASREVMARVSNEFPGSVYQNIRAYDAAGGYHYPNVEECTNDAVFIAEDFKWDGGMRVDGSGGSRSNYEIGTASTNDDDAYWGVPQKTITFSHNASGTNGWVGTSEDTSGSMKIDTLTDPDTSHKDRWPQFNGTVITNKGTGKDQASVSTGKTYTDDNGRTQVRGIQVDATDSSMTTNTTDVFRYVKDPYKIGVPSLDVAESVWRTTDGESKLGNLDTTTGTATDGYLETITNTSAGGNTGWYHSIGGNELVPDADMAYTTPAMPTIRITMSAMSNGKTNYYVQKLRKVQGTGTTAGTYTPITATEPGGAGYPMNFQSDQSDWRKVIYVKGGNVQVVGGTANTTDGSTDATGNPGDGHITVPTTVVADTNVERDAVIKQAIDSPDNHYGSDATGYFDSRLTSANLWDPAAGRYVFKCYKMDGASAGTTVEGTENAEIKGPIWYKQGGDHIMEPSDLQAVKASHPGSYWVFPTQDPNINSKPEGNLSVVGDLTYKKNMESPSLGLVAKNHVYLNDFKHPKLPNMNETQLRAYEASESAADKEQRTLNLNGTVASKFHSMQMDFFNFNNNPYGLSEIPAGARASGTTPPSSLGSRTSGICMVPCADGTISNHGQKFMNMWDCMPTQARQKAWWNYYYGADQPDDGANYNDVYKFGIFKFTGAVISRFADVESDAGNPSGDNAPCMGYPVQNISYDTNLKNRSAPFFSMSCFDKQKAKSLLFWSVLTYVDRGALSETKQNL